MELLQLALVLVAAVLVSAVLEPFLPRVSMPLVQMLIGVVMYFFVDMPGELSIDSDLFLVMFIAPLLFDESRNVNNRALFDNIRTVLSLAIGLVLVLVLVIGFTLHWLVPSVPLAAAFALGAALGPTDAVAVASLGKDIKLNSRQKALLSGEALLNDASGVVSFQFAIAAAVTGAFSLADASRTFLVDFLGGVALGLVIAVLATIVVRQIRRIGVESVTFHVCFEVCLPFFTYLIAERVGVSGILAVVACGLLMAYLPEALSTRRRSRETTTFSSRLSMASESVWNLMSFVLNGIIFTVLGFILPSTIAPALEANSNDIVWLLSLVVVVTLVAEGVRFVWVFVADFLSDHKTTGGRFHLSGKLVRDALVTTLSGPKGAVSLSIALTIPTALASGDPFPQRNLLLFIICGVIIATLLLANFVVPVLAPKPEEDDDGGIDPEVEVSICRNVIRELREQKTPENRRAIALVVRQYNDRIAAARKSNVPARQLRYLRQEVLIEQENRIRELMAADSVDARLAERYLKRIEKARRALTRRHGRTRAVQAPPLVDNTSAIHRLQQRIGDGKDKNSKRARLEFKISVEQATVDYLELVAREMDQVRVDTALALLAEHKPRLRTLKANLRALDRAEGLGTSVPENPDDTRYVRSDDGTLRREGGAAVADDEPEGLADVQAEALRLELDQIQEKLELGLIGASDARELREEIYLVQMGLSDD